jgi:hypothetical protein
MGREPDEATGGGGGAGRDPHRRPAEGYEGPVSPGCGRTKGGTRDSGRRRAHGLIMTIALKTPLRPGEGIPKTVVIRANADPPLNSDDRIARSERQIPFPGHSKSRSTTV